jgi:hypothetical protein
MNIDELYYNSKINDIISRIMMNLLYHKKNYRKCEKEIPFRIKNEIEYYFNRLRGDILNITIIFLDFKFHLKKDLIINIKYKIEKIKGNFIKIEQEFNYKKTFNLLFNKNRQFLIKQEDKKL